MPSNGSNRAAQQKSWSIKQVEAQLGRYRNLLRLDSQQKGR